MRCEICLYTKLGSFATVFVEGAGEFYFYDKYRQESGKCIKKKKINKPFALMSLIVFFFFFLCSSQNPGLQHHSFLWGPKQHKWH